MRIHVLALLLLSTPLAAQEEAPASAPAPAEAAAPPATEEPAREEAAHVDGAIMESKVDKAAGPRIYVVDPALVNLPENLGKTISAKIAQTISEQSLDAMSRDDAREILTNQAELQLLGSDADPLSLANLGKAVGAQHLLAVVATRQDEDTIFQGRLLDATNAKVLVRRETKTSDYDDDTLKAIEELTKLCLAPLFAHLNGMVTVSVTEEGANVLLDGVQLGTSPIKPFEVPGGFHTVTVTKEGFIRFQKSVNPQGEEVAIDVTLQPSLEYMQNWRAEGELYRTVGLVTAGAAVALVAAAAGFGAGMFFTLQERDAKQRSQSDTCAEGDQNFDNCLLVGRDDPELSERTQKVEEAATNFQYMSVGAIAAGAVAVAAASAGTYFFVFGKDPNRYQAFEVE